MRQESKIIILAFDECFPDDDPVLLEKKEDQISFIQEIKESFDSEEHVEVKGQSSYSPLQKSEDDFETCISFEMDRMSSAIRYQRVYVKIFFEKDHKLKIYICDSLNHHNPLCSEGCSANSILTFIQSLNKKREDLEKMVEAREQKKKEKKLKKAKVKSLKNKAIIAKIEEIAREDKFEFIINEMSTKVRLTLKLTKSQKLDIDIPYKDFQNVLQQVRFAIKTILGLRENGVFLQIRGYMYEPSWRRL